MVFELFLLNFHIVFLFHDAVANDGDSLFLFGVAFAKGLVLFYNTVNTGVQGVIATFLFVLLVDILVQGNQNLILTGVDCFEFGHFFEKLDVLLLFADFHF